MDNELIFPPQMNKIFEMLSRGYHICIDDGEMYSDLMENEDFYRKMFELLGFKLSENTGAIFYFLPTDEKINGQSKNFMAFIAIMYDWLADQGKDPISALTEEHFYIDQLPHLTIDQYKKTMGQLDINDTPTLLKQVQGLERHGFLQLIDNSMIKFRKPVSRFVTIFTSVSDGGCD
ncbi:MAG: hypothetical protein KAH20_10695 [Methylococcales bacterium]|nr:hypothetical protein [Methylococcales bacterium]